MEWNICIKMHIMFFLGFNKIWTFLVHFGSLFFWSARRPFAVITDLILALSQICSFLDQNAAHFSSLVCMQVKFAVITDLAASTILYFTVSRGDAKSLYLLSLFQVQQLYIVQMFHIHRWNNHQLVELYLSRKILDNMDLYLENVWSGLKLAIGKSPLIRLPLLLSDSLSFRQQQFSQMLLGWNVPRELCRV